jgi:hypothetical protein
VDPVSDEAVRTPEALCWHCDKLLSGAFTMEGATPQPEPGNLSFCLYCGAICIYDPDLILRAPTRELLDELRQDEEFRREFVAFQWTRQRAILEAKLMGYEGPDR